jgi:hypothetical protein
VGNFTHADVLKLYANGTVDCDMLIITTQTDQDTNEVTEVEQYREKGTSFLEPLPFELTEDEINSLNPNKMKNLTHPEDLPEEGGTPPTTPLPPKPIKREG